MAPSNSTSLLAETIFPLLRWAGPKLLSVMRFNTQTVLLAGTAIVHVVSKLPTDNLVATAAQRCSPAHLKPSLDIPNRARIQSVTAHTVTASTSFCNVTVTYGHPGFNDTIHTNVYLPLSGWNGRFQGVGGGGWAAESPSEYSLSPVAEGYATGSTDAGHSLNPLSSTAWAFLPNGKPNIPLLEDFAYLAIGELADIGKQVTKRFYGADNLYAYWNGCSTGGRQGLMMAQRYPTAYDGISAAAPAIHWTTFIVAEYWGQYLMNTMDHYPPNCAFDTITAAAVAACDGLDGVLDGVISALSECHFNPHTLVGRPANCTNGTYTITKQDAEIVSQVWQGARNADGGFLWWGNNPGTPFEGLVATTCSNGTTDCTGTPFPISTDWITNWVLDNPDYDLQNLTAKEYAALFPSAYKQYDSIIGTDNPDLSQFKRAGGKMISWHGLADELIFPQGTESYYRKVEAQDPSVRDFYRFFPAPGVNHCAGGQGEVPSDPLGAVIAWVENGTAPDTLPAVSVDGTRSRNLCQFPLVSVYKGGDPAQASSFFCGRNWTDIYDGH